MDYRERLQTLRLTNSSTRFLEGLGGQAPRIKAWAGARREAAARLRSIDECFVGNLASSLLAIRSILRLAVGEQASGKTRRICSTSKARTLESMPPETQSTDPVPATPRPGKKLVPLRPNVRRHRVLEGCKESGKGNFWDAALLAFEYPMSTRSALADGARRRPPLDPG